VIEPHEWEELSGLLQRYAPGRRVWAFGSRATGQRVRRFSDLDIAVEGEELPFDEMAMLREALDESRLPFKVDVVQTGYARAGVSLPHSIGTCPRARTGIIRSSVELERACVACVGGDLVEFGLEGGHGISPCQGSR
jgi:predicted nucleotidyltransferase